MSLRHHLLASLSLTLVACGGAVVSPTSGSGNDGGADVPVLTDALMLNDLPIADDRGGPGLDVLTIPDGGGFPTDLAQPIDTRVPRCGDRILDPGESCDDGNNSSGDGCSAMCRFEMR
jgi:cysteine-rich repeat protein